MDRQGLQAGATLEAVGFNADASAGHAAQGDFAIPLLQVLGRLMDFADGNKQVARRLIDDVMTYQIKDLELLRMYCEQHDRQAIAKLCHKVAGAACVLKYHSLISSCQQLREICMAGPWPLLLERAQRVEHALLSLKDICFVAMQDDGSINLEQLPRG